MNAESTLYGMNQSGFFALVDMGFLLVAALTAMFYLNQRRYHMTNLRSIAVSIIAASAFGRALAYFWPGDYSELIPWLRLGIDGGLMLVFGALAWGRVQQLFGEPPMRTFHRDALELAVHARTQEEYEMVRLAAAAALRQDGVDRRVDARPDHEEENDFTLAIRK